MYKWKILAEGVTYRNSGEYLFISGFWRIKNFIYCEVNFIFILKLDSSLTCMLKYKTYNIAQWGLLP